MGSDGYGSDGPHLSANQSFVFDQAQEPKPLQVPFLLAKLHAITFVICMAGWLMERGWVGHTLSELFGAGFDKV